MTSTTPYLSPRRSTESLPQYIGGVFDSVSPFDPRCKLHIDPIACDTHIEYHTDAPLYAINSLVLLAHSRGYVVDDDHDPLYDDVYVSDGVWRTYLVPSEPVRDVPLEASLPDLSLTACGPHSGFMEAVTG